MSTRYALNRTVHQIELSLIRVFENRVHEYEDGISLAVGQPDSPTPEHVSQAGILAIKGGRTRYTVNQGLSELRHAVTRTLERVHGASYDPDSEVIVTAGASEALDIAFRAILNPGDEVVVPSPGYSGYAPLVQLAGGVVRFVDVRGHRGLYGAAELKSVLSPRTRCVVLPCANPSGVRMTADDIVSLMPVLRQTDCYVLADEIYADMTYDGGVSTLGVVNELRDRALIVRGLSKSHSMTGWRIGFLLGPSFVTEQALKIHQYLTACASSVSQYAALAAFDDYRADVAHSVDLLRDRRAVVVERLTGLGLDCWETSAGFFAFPSIRSTGLGAYEFADRLLEQEHVALVPGTAFGPFGEGYVRISYAVSTEQLISALDRLTRFVTQVATP